MIEESQNGQLDQSNLPSYKSMGITARYLIKNTGAQVSESKQSNLTFYDLNKAEKKLCLFSKIIFNIKFHTS